MLSIRTRLACYAGLAFAGLVLVLLVLRPAPDALDNPAFDALARAHTRKLAAQAASLDSARTALSLSSARVSTSLVRYRTVRDSVFVPVTKAETVAVLDRLPTLLAAADSMHRACTALAQDCDTFRVRAESSLAGLTVDRDRFKDLYNSYKPSRWAPVREWAIRIGIGYGAFKLGQAAR